MTTVSVTRPHLAKGIPGDTYACAVVLAVRAAFPGARHVTAGHRYISMYRQGRSELLVIPEDTRPLIEAIDRGEPVQPFTFDLDYPAVTP